MTDTNRTSNPISEWRAAAASYEGYTTVAERDGRVGRMYRAGLALAEIAGKWRGTLERLERQLRGYAEFSPADELHRTVTDALAGLPDETTTLTEAEELLKAWADPLPPNGRLYWAHVEKAREYFKKRPAVEPSEQLPTETGLRPGELAQLRRIDAAARFYVDSVKPGSGVAWENLMNALFDGRPEETKREHLHWCAIRIGKHCNCHSEGIEQRLSEKASAPRCVCARGKDFHPWRHCLTYTPENGPGEQT